MRLTGKHLSILALQIVYMAIKVPASTACEFESLLSVLALPK